MQTVSRKARQLAWRDRHTTVNLLVEVARKQQHVAELLTRLREQGELSQEDAARKAHVGYRSYQRWEAGEAMPHPENLKKLARAFGVRLDELLPPSRVNDEVESTVVGNAERLDRIEKLLTDILAALTPRAAEAPLAPDQYPPAEDRPRDDEDEGDAPTGTEGR